MSKTITLIGINFYPEDTAIGLYSTQLAEYLSENGFIVNVITGFPYYPAWKISKEYKNKKRFLYEKLNKINIYRYKQYVPENPGFIKRIFHLTDFTIGNFFNLPKIKNTNVVIAVVPFTSDILLGKILAKRKKAKLWVHIQDFEFDAALESKLSKNVGFIFKILFYIEKKLLISADLGTTISNSMLKKLNKKTNNSINTALLPNWVDLKSINPDKSKTHPYLKSEKFKILYSGNMGEKQDWSFFVELVKQTIDDEIEFIVVGNGAKRKWVEEQLTDKKNIKFYNPVPYEQLSDLLCSTDLHVLFQKEEVVDTVMPSKILGMFASGKPSIITGNNDSEVKTIMQESNAGFYFSQNNFLKITEAIYKLKNNKNKSQLMGKNARNYAQKNYSKEKILLKFKEQLEKLINTTT